MAGENCLLSVPGWGERRVVATEVTHGMSIFTWMNQEDKSRRGKTFNTYKRTSGSFDVTLVFTTQPAHERMMRWLEQYGRFISSGYSPPRPMRVLIPSRNFDKTGIPESDIPYGEKVGEVIWKVQLGFMGSSDPQDLHNEDLYSTFALPVDSDPALPHLYPMGEQLSGRASGDDIGATEFDEPAKFPGTYGGGGGFGQGGAGGSSW